MGFAAGVETRRDNGAVTHDECSRSSCYWQNFGDDFAGELSVIEGYAETLMPFLRDKPGVELLELDVAVRRTNYENFQPAHDEYYNNGTIIAVEDQKYVSVLRRTKRACSTIRRSGCAFARRGRATFARRIFRSSTSAPRASALRARRIRGPAAVIWP